jgi:hypothetical protein
MRATTASALGRGIKVDKSERGFISFIALDELFVLEGVRGKDL